MTNTFMSDMDFDPHWDDEGPSAGYGGSSDSHRGVSA
jgi:hypothetical protein